MKPTCLPLKIAAAPRRRRVHSAYHGRAALITRLRSTSPRTLIPLLSPLGHAEVGLGRADVVPDVVRAAAEGFGDQVLPLLTLPDADVPGADLGLAGVVLGIDEHLLEAGVGLLFLPRLGVDVADPLPVAGLRFAVGDGVEQRLPLRLVARQVIDAPDADPLPRPLPRQLFGLGQRRIPGLFRRLAAHHGDAAPGGPLRPQAHAGPDEETDGAERPNLMLSHLTNPP